MEVSLPKHTVLCFITRLHHSAYNLRPAGFSSFRRQSRDQRDKLIKKMSFAVEGGVVGLKRGCSRVGVKLGFHMKALNN